MNNVTQGRKMADDTRLEHDFSKTTHTTSGEGDDSLSIASQSPTRRPQIHLSSTIRALPPRNVSDTEHVVSLQQPILDHRNHEDIQGNTEKSDHPRDERINMNLERILETYEGRLETFRDWPVSFLAAESVAEAMFLYTGDKDIVMCVNCGGELSDWQAGDDPSEEHLLCFGFVCNSNV